MAAYSFAFQPIVETDNEIAWAQEALVRGIDGAPAYSVLDGIEGDDLYLLSTELQLAAIRAAVAAGWTGRLSLNTLNGSLKLDPNAMQKSVALATELGMSSNSLMFEVSERDAIDDPDEFLTTIRPTRSSGSDFALDDFGAGYSGLNLLASFQPNYIKLDRVLVNDIHRNGPRQAIVRGVLRTCLDLGIEVIAEGVEQLDEYEWLWVNGVRLYQGFLFARPAFESIATPTFPKLGR